MPRTTAIPATSRPPADQASTLRATYGPPIARTEHRSAPRGQQDRSAVVLFIAARGDARGAAAADVAAAQLRDQQRNQPATVVATHSSAPDLADSLRAARSVHVLDPGRTHAFLERLRTRLTGISSPMTAPAKPADRLALLDRLRDRQHQVRWSTHIAQLDQALGSTSLGSE